MKITWVNHASFLIEHGDVKLLADPWLFGHAFNGGWELLLETTIEPEVWETVTHIWFSHEHPDHFSVPCVKFLHEKCGHQAEVLYQETADKRVVGFCAGLGFKTRELPNCQTVEIAEDFKVTVGVVPFYDSWIMIEAGGLKVLNLNDCVLKTRPQYDRIKSIVGSVDVLMPQFGYANWEGNPEDVARQKESAEEKLRRVTLAAEVFEPEFTIPHASFFVFAVPENDYLNKHNNSIKDAFERLEQTTKTTPVSLLPGEEWDLRTKIDSAHAVEQYLKAAADYQGPQTANIKPKTQDEILERFQKYYERIKSKNSGIILAVARLFGIMPDVQFFVSDLNKVATYRQSGHLVFSDGTPDPNKHVSLSSDSLWFLFANEYGFDTLTVNGRFRSTPENFSRMFRAFALASLNNMGYGLNFGLVFKIGFFRRVVTKIRID